MPVLCHAYKCVSRNLRFTHARCRNAIAAARIVKLSTSRPFRCRIANSRPLSFVVDDDCSDYSLFLSISVSLFLSRPGNGPSRRACTHAEVRRPWDGRVISRYAKRADVLEFAHANTYTRVRTRPSVVSTSATSQSLARRRSISDSLY